MTSADEKESSLERKQPEETRGMSGKKEEKEIDRKADRQRRFRRLLNLVIGIVCCVFAGYAVCVYMDYRKRPDVYLAQSAPWYTGILVYGMFAAVIILIAVVFKWLGKRFYGSCAGAAGDIFREKTKKKKIRTEKEEINNRKDIHGKNSRQTK